MLQLLPWVLVLLAGAVPVQGASALHEPLVSPDGSLVGSLVVLEDAGSLVVLEDDGSLVVLEDDGSLVVLEDDKGWICDAADNICGLRDKRKLSLPAKVDWDALLDATSEIQEMKKNGIDPDTPEGIRLRQKAKERVTKACEAERQASGYCSVWKDISHKDGRSITDITAQVRARL